MMQMICQLTCIIPKIAVTPSKLIFRQKCQTNGTDCTGNPVGEVAKSTFIVKNLSSVNAKIEFDFGNCKDFAVECGSEELLNPFSSRKYLLNFKPAKVCLF